MNLQSTLTPKILGYHFPAEWEKHEATWLSWPHNMETWPGPRLKDIMPSYMQFIKEVSKGEKVRINVSGQQMKDEAMRQMEKHDIDPGPVEFFFHPTNDSWCRDHGPAFLIKENSDLRKVIVNWEYNAWGGKYPPYDLDNQIPLKIAKSLELPVYSPGIVMEGGSVEFNGKGALLTTESCLLNKNRNPHLSKIEIEKRLVEFYGIDEILWLHDGIAGDDTDGHIDDLTRFVSEDTVISVYEEDKTDSNYEILKSNIKQLNRMRLQNGKQLHVIEIPLPHPIYSEGLRMPASYANFYIANHCVVVPIYKSIHDQLALGVIKKCFPDRETVGIDSTNIIWGLGSFHCLCQQEPA